MGVSEPAGPFELAISETERWLRATGEPPVGIELEDRRYDVLDLEATRQRSGRVWRRTGDDRAQIASVPVPTNRLAARTSYMALDVTAEPIVAARGKNGLGHAADR